MRRALALLLLFGLAMTGCVGRREGPPPAEPGPIVKTGSGETDSGGAAPTGEPAGVTQGEPSGLEPEPASGLKELIAAAPAGSMERMTVAAGQSLDRAGLYFLKVATGEVEGWTAGNEASYALPAPASPDDRWLSMLEQEQVYLADRKSGSVFRYPANQARLLAARGDLLLFMTASRFWLVSDGLKHFEPVELPPEQQAAAVIAPDGLSVALLSGRQLHLIDAATGADRKIELPTAENGEAPHYALSAIRGGAELLVTIANSGGHPTANRLLRFSWQGQTLADQSSSHDLIFSPDGNHVAWRAGILNLESSIVVGAADLSPKWRVTGTVACSSGTPGPFWLSDGSGLVVNTSEGARLLKLDGSLAGFAWWGERKDWDVPIPAPDRPDRFAATAEPYSGGDIRVVDGTGRELARAVVAKEKHFGATRLLSWSETGEEVRFILHNFGKGVSCTPNLFPPTVEQAPFPTPVGLQVKVAGNDCVNLRQEISTESAVVACLPNGTRLRAAKPPGVYNKGIADDWGNPAGEDMGGQYWWRVRTEQGQRGWVHLSGEYLAWDYPRSGEAAPDPIMDRAEDEVANLDRWLRVAIGKETCTIGCPSGPSGPSVGPVVWALLESTCRAPVADNLRAEPGFDPARHEPVLKRLEDACEALRSAKDSLGEPADTPEWKEKASEVEASLK